MRLLPDAHAEPVKRNGYTAAVIVGASTFFGALAVVPDITPQVVYGGLSVALAQIALIGFGARATREQVYAPATYDRDVDAEAVIYQPGT